MLSVIVPVYNAEKYLTECIESILHQSFAEIELLLVDDGSTDKSLEICRSYETKDARVRLLAQTHQGPFFARKQGVSMARGAYVTFADADDFVAQESYSLAKEDMERKIDVISFGLYRYHGQQSMRSVHERLPQGVYDRARLESEIFPLMLWDERNDSFGIDPALWNKFYRRELVRDIFNRLEDISFHYGEDVAVIYPLLERAQSVSIHYEAYYYHRQRTEGSIAPYLAEEDFLDKLYLLYRHLCTCFADNQRFRRQAELFYAYAVQLVKTRYRIPLKTAKAIFPFDRVDKNERIVIYGAGNLGKTYIGQLDRLQYGRVVLWADRDYERMGNGVQAPRMIKKTAFDKLVIAIDDPDVREQVKHDLIGIGVQEDRII